MKTSFRILSIVLAFAFFAGCEKPQEGQGQGKDPDPIVNPDPLDPAARLVRVITEYTGGGHNVSDISYDSKGRMTKLTGGQFLGENGICNIEYNDAAHTATAQFKNGTIVMELDDAGRCVNDGLWRYSYFGGHMVSIQSASGSTTCSFSWDDDCLTGFDYGRKITEGITYDTHDNPFYGQSYDPFCSIDRGIFTESMCLCFCSMSSKKLLKNYFSTEFSYSFAEDGRLKEVMISEGGVPQSIFYASYSDETLRQPRDEKTEELPLYLKGDWVITGIVSGGEEVPSLDIYQGGISLPDLELNFEAAVDIYRIEEGSIQKLITEVDGNCVNYSDGVLSGVIGEPYDNAFNKETIVYKSGYLHFVGYTGEWGNGLDITKINDNKFYCKGFNHSSITYVYERVNQLTEAVENPKEEILPGSIIISNDVQNGTCNLAILEKGLSIDETTGELAGNGKAIYFIIKPTGEVSHTGNEDELPNGTYLSSNSSIKAESMIFMSSDDFAKMNGVAISNATLTVSHSTKDERFYYSGTFEFSADGKKYSGSFSDLVNSGVKKELETNINAGSIFIFNDVKDGICNLAILEQGLSIDETTGELSGNGNTVYFILPSNDGGEDELAAGTYSSGNSTIKSESMMFTSPEEFAKMSGKAISDATLNVTRETRSEEIYYSGNFEFYADGKKFSGSFKDLKNSVMHKEINPPEPTPENVAIRLAVEGSGTTKSSLTNGTFNLDQGDIVYVNASPTSVQMAGSERYVIVPYNEKGYDIVYPGKDYDGTALLLRTYYLDDGIKYSINMPFYTRGIAEPVCMGYIADPSLSACDLRIMTGLLSVTLADGLDASKIELTADNNLEGVFDFKVTNHDYSSCTISHDSTPSAGIIVDVSQSSSRTFYFNLMPGSYKIGIKVIDKNDQVLVQKSTTSEIPVERAHIINLGTLQIDK